MLLSVGADYATMTRLDADTLESFATSLLVELGTPADIAGKVAASLVAADLRGHTSHGVLRIPTYRDMITDGALVPDATPAIVRDEGSTAVVDGRSAFGQFVGRVAVDHLVERAREYGVASVGIREATHLGRMGEWAERTTGEGLCYLSLVHTSGGSLVVAPAGSTTRRFSTNPVTVGVPTFDRLPFPLVLDMATSQVAHGKVHAYHADDREIPGEWAVGDDGQPLTDPSGMVEFQAEDPEGALRPVGGTTSGHKGTGLAVMAELFAGLLGGGPVVGQTDPQSWFTNGAFMFAVDPTRFDDRDTMARKVSALVEHYRAADSHPDVPVGDAARSEDPLLPGESEHRTHGTRQDDGIPLPDRVVDSLVELADAHGVEHPFEG